MGGQEIDTTSAMGELLLTLLGGIAQFERANMLERQREGIAKATRAGKYKGRVPTVMRQAAEIKQMVAAGMKPTEVAKRLKVARSSVYLALKAEAA